MLFSIYDTPCSDVVDDKRTFKFFFDKFPELLLQWIGRIRSSGEKGVGYLSFLIRTELKLERRKPDGFFITAYDDEMRGRECLGEIENWSPQSEKDKINLVLNNARTSSRLTNEDHLDVPVNYYQITYLFKRNTKHFIRGWHSISADAFYLSDVLLEHTFEDGTWINETHNEWKTKSQKFNLDEVFKQLYSKKTDDHDVTVNSNKIGREYELYTSECVYKIDNTNNTNTNNTKLKKNTKNK